MLSELRLTNIDDEVLQKLKFKAENKGVDLNTFILMIFKRALDIEESEEQDLVYDDLTYLSGTWSEEDAVNFLEETESFNKIDDELWQ